MNGLGAQILRRRWFIWRKLPYTRGGRLGSLPSMGYALGGKFGEGRAGTPGDQALLRRDGTV